MACLKWALCPSFFPEKAGYFLAGKPVARQKLSERDKDLKLLLELERIVSKCPQKTDPVYPED